MGKTEKEIDDKQRELFRNLTVAHKSSLLVYSKDGDRYASITCE
jgi:hypothetical protein